MTAKNSNFPIDEIAPRDAYECQREGSVLIDVREEHERALGMAEGALGVAKAAFEAAPQRSVAEVSTPVLLICAKGGRSLESARRLVELGYRDVKSVAGGTEAWRAAGLPMTQPAADADFLDRYSRHLLLPQVGLAGQQKLERSRVFVVGAGGLGSPVTFYLAAAGVGTLVIADDDRVERSNLQRQILHTEAAIGTPKVESAARALTAMNPRVHVEAVQERVTSANVDRLLEGADLVIDGADNFPLRYLLNDACIKHAKPLVYGAVHRFEGQVSVFDAGRKRGIAPCYRCLFPQPPRAEDAPNCAEAGVLGVLPGVVGLLQANEAIKLLLGIGDPLAGRLLGFDALAGKFRETRLSPDPACPICPADRAFPGYVDYEQFCAAGG
jgi:molybdopterin/thiamine biosynthesis adenylyltransferase/rhodanese-related sulfurtransferase